MRRLHQAALWDLGVAAFLTELCLLLSQLSNPGADAASVCRVSAEATCITEMSVLMACWKQNNFADSLCFTEMKSFYTCVDKAQVRRLSDCAACLVVAAFFFSLISGF